MLSRMLTSPLSGIRLAEFTRLVAKPYASMILNDLRAEVRNVLQPHRYNNGICKWVPPQIDQHSCYYLCSNKNCKSLGTELQHHDIGGVTENCNAGENTQLRLGKEQLLMQNVRLYCSDSENRPVGNGDSAVDSSTSADDQGIPEMHDKMQKREERYDYDACLGEVINHRYYVIRTLGWGRCSTVWLCWDTKMERFVALKIVRSERKLTDASFREREMLRCVDKEENNGEHRNRVVQMYDEFILDGPSGLHMCLVFEVLGCSLVHPLLVHRSVSLSQVRTITRQILEGLCHLHDNCQIMHMEIDISNVLITMSQEQIMPMAAEALSCIENDEPWTAMSETSPATASSTELAHSKNESRDCSYSQMAEIMKPIILTEKSCNEIKEVKIADLGTACWVHNHYTDDIRDNHHSLEIIIGAEYGPPCDIWSAACVAFALATGEDLFAPVGTKDYSVDEDHMAFIIDLLGPIPSSIYEKGSKWRNLFNESGGLLHRTNLRPWSLYDVLTQKFRWNAKDANDFCDFLIPMLNYDQNERPTAKQCLEHPWLQQRPAAAQNTASMDSEDLEGEK